ncbi:major facilitator superfamily domain-containing protein [Bipolaris maydis]|nr:MFS general substrate transporter [Bipolaris maydis]KAJ5059938.1 major facilitator superfamily domain-containing protein [Bipolaris maydis]KAJ6197096.1 major facilitator superfamily domain-containing protein [Bipolaris maydis]KAJ6209938.1 major facilitator superfamily domain-containing protein [Bipolaris maydis]KAJ6271099.1 MFS general substrate transporter [Bipolaris maydis]
MALTADHAFEKDAQGPDVSALPRTSLSPERAHHSDEEGLPPRDRGRSAWVCLVAVSAISMATWGFGATQGVFREYYFNNPPFEGNQLVASIGLLVVGILQSLSPFLLPLIGRYSQFRPHMMWTGMTLVVASCLGAAFSTTALQVIMTQGMMYGLSSGLLFAPCISFVDEWFLKRRGLANGIFFGSANIASSALSPIFARLLDQYGPRTTLIGWTVFIAVTISLGIVFIRPRRPHGVGVVVGAHKQELTLKPFKSLYFWLFVSSMAVQSLANNLPANYLPSYATDLGVDSTKAALLVTYLSLSGIIGQVSLGALTDKIGPLVPMLLSTLVSAFAVLVVWGLGKAYWTMVIVSLLFGAFAFSFMVLRSHMAAIVVNDPNRPAEELLVSGVLLFTRGVVGVVSGYIASAVLQSSESTEIDYSYGAGKWRTLIILLGTTMTAATVGAIGLRRRKLSV